jgi:molybdopterin converting factor subunit 1
VNTVRVKLFARARDLAGTGEVAVDLPPGATVADLRRRLTELYPTLREFLGRCAVAVADEFADDEQAIPVGAEAALLPPVSGG